MSHHPSQQAPAGVKTSPQSTLSVDNPGVETRTPSRFPTLRAVGKLWKKTRRGLLIALLVFAVTHASLNIYASLLLNRELAEIRQKGEPATLVELAPPDVSESKNAAPLYKQAISAWNLTKAEEALLSQSLKPGSSVDDDVRAALQKSQKALQLTRRAASRPDCRFPIDWSAPPYQILLPHYAEARRLARLLAAQALQSARTGDSNGALGDVRAIFWIDDHISKEPILIGFLVARAINALAYQALARVLETAPISPAQARSFLSSLPKTDWSTAYRRTLLGERTFTLWGFNAARSNWQQARELSGDENTPGPLKWIASPLGLVWTPFLKLDEVYSLRLWKRSIAAITPMQVPAPIITGKTIDIELQHAPLYAIMTRVLFPVFSRSREIRDAIEVSQREMEIALALSAYRSTHGRYPSQLQQVGPLQGKTLPTDPYSNKPFFYQSDGRNFTLYSVGVNRTDDGGHGPHDRYTRPASEPTGDDIAWNYKAG